MKRDELLELIWSDAVEYRSSEEMSPLSKLLACLLERPVVGLVVRGSLDTPVAMFEGDELFPGTSLSDVLDQELSIEVEEGALVVIEPLEFADADRFSGRALGEMLGAILVDLAGYSHDIDEAGQHPALTDALVRAVTQNAGQGGAFSGKPAQAEVKAAARAVEVPYLI